MVRLTDGAYVGIGDVTPYTTNGSSADIDVWFPVTAATDNLQLERDSIVLEDLGSEAEVETYFVAGQRRITGSLVLQVDIAKIPDILRAFLGNGAAPAGTGPYTYTQSPISRGAAAHYMLGTTDRGLTIEVYRGGGVANSLYYHGCIPTELQWRFEKNAFVELTMNFIGRAATLEAKSTASIDTSALLPTTTGQVATTCQLASSTYVAHSATITMRNGLDFRHDLTGVETLLPQPTSKYEFMLDLDIEVDDDSFVTTNKDDPVGGLFGLNNYLNVVKDANTAIQFNFEKLRLESSGEPRAQGQGPIRWSGQFKALAATTASYGLGSVVTVNQQSAYLLT